MKDVAREAGVALGTVSKVFNGITVGESYRIKVETAAQKLGYQVNQYARGLRASKTYTVAVILPGVDHPFFAALAQHLCTALAQRDHRMLLYVTASRPDMEQLCVKMVRQNRVDGIIGLTYNPLQIDDDLPFVSIDRSFAADVPCVASDNYSGGRIAAEKLLELGCQRLAFLRIGSANPSETDKRGDGFEMVCRTRNIHYDAIRLKDGEDLAQFKEFFRSHMKGGKIDIDGFFCSTDLLAWRIQQMLQELGIRVPEDVQIIGFDGIRRFGGESLYCSTIVQPVQKIAETSVDLLLDKDRANAPSLICLPVAYAPGGTTRE
ncbi:MAG: LacI family DNA-binding transcriptional regulator [Oscillospiraceae bacterium]|nr:LacI family DNA-binding transcriptional regulator [Oscillospiraceae bacterium]